ncbi:acyl-CoA synthetase (NDP forming)/GNAT superfamily N-acetyltransferase [Actinoplanes octamycinicus]|uniref:Acyl-CoA synthetase (NDP forming)/GNAT superfamily N-acetyltransferase n=1 Tax=Actinoplanes octamycinicus TaxID=135948 RepID=A0A7W7H2J9_9ACTN|nr:GNAT family N-acetyltransferase [Actinoplanes octamycinicus]MBB4742780.1 acyl-CoA synthetase (NDP forming)/GNAT superfamily N-acetyltransferase [Actinoplanes octamycinicus]
MTSTPLISDPDGADALASDGGIVTIRPVRPGDRGALARLYAGASRENLLLRFFIVPGRLTIAAELDSLCRQETRDRLAVVAWQAGELIGVAACVRLDRHSRMAEIAAFVADDHHGRGIGTLLLEHLAARARLAGITDFVGEMLPGNTDVLRMVHDFHEHTHTQTRVGYIDLNIDLTDQHAFERAVDARDRVAEQASLRPLLAPRSVAVIGAGQRHGTAGHETLRALRDYGFAGRLYAINPTGRPVCGLPSHRSIGDLPEAVDLAVIAVRAELVAGALKEAGQRGVRAAVVLSKGFGASGPVSKQRRADVLRIAREHGMRLVGPSSIGVLGTEPQLRLNACLSPIRPPGGGLAVASQSGTVGIALLANAARTGCGVSSFVSLGEKLDVSGNDLIAYWYDDPATKAVALYLESFGNPRRFARTVRALGRRKPVLALESGRSLATRHAGAASPDLMDALFTQAGVIRVTGIDEMLDSARMLIDQPAPAGARMAIVGNGGGLTALAADHAVAGGFTLVSLSRDTRRQLPRGRDNPVDLGIEATPATIAAAAETIANSGEADILLLMIVGTRANCSVGTMAALAEVVDNHPDVTIAAVLTGSNDDIQRFGARGAPVFPQPETAIRALAHAHRYARWQRQPLGRRPELPGIQPARAQALIGQALATGPGWLPRIRVAAVLRAYGISIMPMSAARTGVDAVAIAERLGFPVVLRSAAPATARGPVVRRDLSSAAAVRDAFDAVVADSPGPAGVLLQRQITAPVELTAGIRHDSLFGSLVRLGLSGGWTAHTVRLVPLTDLDAGRMWRDLPAGSLSGGLRKPPRFEPADLEDLLLRLGRLAEDHPEIAELDLAPVFAGPDGLLIGDARIRLAETGAEPDATLRRLSPVALPGVPARPERGTSDPVRGNRAAS